MKPFLLANFGQKNRFENFNFCITCLSTQKHEKCTKHEKCVAFKNASPGAKVKAILMSLNYVTSMHLTFDEVIFVMSQKLYMKIKIIKRTSM